MKNLLSILLCILLGFSIRGWIDNWGRVDNVIVNEVVKWDTVFVEKPVPDTVLLTEYVSVPVPYPEIEYQIQHDTIYISLQKEQKVYSDSLYKAWISGYKPTLDSIEVYTPTRYIETIIPPKKPKKLGIGISAGYGATKDGLTPYIGVGLTYDLISF